MAMDILLLSGISQFFLILIEWILIARIKYDFIFTLSALRGYEMHLDVLDEIGWNPHVTDP